jgi:hypothetical protein
MHHLSTIIQGLVKNLKEILFMRIVIELKKQEHNIPHSSLDARKDTHTLFPSTTEPVEHQSSAAVEITLLQSQLQTEIAERQRLEALLLSQINTEEESQTEQKRYQRQDAISQLGQRSILNRNLDHLFDEGWISFGDNEDILVSNKITPGLTSAWAIDVDHKIGKFTDSQSEFLEFHRSKIFRG